MKRVAESFGPAKAAALAAALFWMPANVATAQMAAPPAAPMAPPIAMTPAAQALLAAEDIRFAAELKHDTATLDRMTADDLVYSHFTGQREDKASVLRSFAHAPFTAITPSDRYARVIGDTGIVRGKVARPMPGRTLVDGYLAVYVHRDHRWQLLEWVTASPGAAEH